jgi:hypothetical protein
MCAVEIAYHGIALKNVAADQSRPFDGAFEYQHLHPDCGLWCPLVRVLL